MSNRILFAAGITLLTSAAVIAPANALEIFGLKLDGPAQDNGPPKETVAYADLNLANPAGAKALLIRIKSAATRVCGAEPSLHDATALSNYRACKKQAQDNAVKALNLPLVTAMYSGTAMPAPMAASAAPEGVSAATATVTK